MAFILATRENDAFNGWQMHQQEILVDLCPQCTTAEATALPGKSTQ